jgi:hypothetical protein
MARSNRSLGTLRNLKTQIWTCNKACVSILVAMIKIGQKSESVDFGNQQHASEELFINSTTYIL